MKEKRPVIRFDALSGDEISEHASLTEAAEAVGASPQEIHDACVGRKPTAR